jgi:adenylate kinase family enzyme
MERVIIIGCGGAGKSTLARKLGEKTGLPVIHLDQVWWSPGNWQHMERPDFEKQLMKEMEKPRWILDGNFRRTLEMRLSKCDTVIYLDFPSLVCLKNWLGRVIKNWGHARADMAEGCTERFDPEFALWIWNFNKNHRARFYELLNHAEGKRVIILKSRREVERFLKTL